MSDLWQTREERVLELLADRAAFGLESADERELRLLLETMPNFDSECMERAAATVQLAFTPPEPMPEAIRAEIRRSGIRLASQSSEE
jgi:hypothetical protein